MASKSDIIPFSGFMNGDDPNENIPIGTHSYANNLIFRGNKGDMRVENLPGTRAISFSLPSGTNVCIGSHYDQVNNQVFYFNYNSNGNHGIYIFNVATEVIQTLIQTGTNTTGDPLAFDPTKPISSIDIFYGDSNTGNILLFLDSLGRPTKINIQRYLLGTYSGIKRSYIDVAKAPPQMPVKAVYENENSSSSSTFNTTFNLTSGTVTVTFTGSIVAGISISVTIVDSYAGSNDGSIPGQLIYATWNYTTNGSETLTSIAVLAKNYFNAVLGNDANSNVLDIYNATNVAGVLTVINNPSATNNSISSGTGTNTRITNVSVNNLRNQLFQFIYRYVYDDNEKSVWSSASIVPLPNQSFLTLTQNDPTLNSRISLFFSTGDVDVQQIEVAFRYIKDGILSDYYLISSFNKTNLSIPSNSIYWYKFYNSDSYNPVQKDEQINLQSFVPQFAQAGALINGNVLTYGNITEGYNQINSNMSVATNSILASSANGYYFDYNGLLFFATINSLDSGSTGTIMNIYLYGTGTNTSGSVTTLNNSYATFVINVLNNSSANVGTTYSTSSDSNTVSSILTAISSALVTNGFTQVSLSGNVLSVSYPSTLTLLNSGTSPILASQNFTSTAVFGYQGLSYQSMGVMYFDSKGRTNGAIINTNASFNTPYLNLNNTTYNAIYNTLSIYHRPPSWASYYQIIRTPNLTYSKLLFWATNGAYSDTYANTLGYRYAYLQIDNIFDYNQYIEATNGVVNYSFSPGDRVKINGRFTSTGAVGTITTNYDYEILGVVNSFNLNGITKVGTFLQIYYPTSDIDTNFKFDGSIDYLSYRLVIYNLTKHSNDTASQTYFEFGKCYGIGNPGTNTAYHIGDSQTQSTDLSTPALISTQNGDYILRNRIVPIGQTYMFTSTSYGQGNVYISPALTTTLAGSNSIYTVQNSALVTGNSLPTDYTSGNFFFLNTGSNPLTVRIRFNLAVGVDAPTGTAVIFQSVTSAGVYTLVTAVNPIQMVSLTSYNIPVDSKITVPANGKLRIIIQNTRQVINQNISATNIQIDVINNVTIPILEKSFSDVYNLPINSNGRPSVYNPNSLQATNNVLIRFSEPYQTNTNINGMSLFYPLNTDEVSKNYGAIQRLITHKRTLKIFQYRKVGVKGIYNKFIKTNNGTTELIVSDRILDKNNIEYYSGDYGIGNQVLSIAHNDNDFYYTDPIKGCLVRLAEDGDINLTEKYKQQVWAGANIPNYLTNHAYAYGGYAKILGVYNFKKDKNGEYICCLQNGSGVTGSTIAFDEENNAFTSFYDIHPDMLLCAENKLISWLAGSLYVHDNTSAYNTFYGTAYNAAMQMVYNKPKGAKKDWVYMGWDAPSGSYWSAPNVGDVTTSLGQQSNILSTDLDYREGIYGVAFLRDYNSPGGIPDGDYLKGQWVEVKLTNSDTTFTYLYSFFISMMDSSKNF